MGLTKTMVISAVLSGWLSDRLIDLKGATKVRIRKTFIVAGLLDSALISGMAFINDGSFALAISIALGARQHVSLRRT